MLRTKRKIEGGQMAKKKRGGQMERDFGARRREAVIRCQGTL